MVFARSHRQTAAVEKGKGGGVDPCPTLKSKSHNFNPSSEMFVFSHKETIGLIAYTVTCTNPALHARAKKCHKMKLFCVQFLAVKQKYKIFEKSNTKTTSSLQNEDTKKKKNKK